MKRRGILIAILSCGWPGYGQETGTPTTGQVKESTTTTGWTPPTDWHVEFAPYIKTFTIEGEGRKVRFTIKQVMDILEGKEEYRLHLDKP